MAYGPAAVDLNHSAEDGLSARALLSSIRRHPAIVLAFTLSLSAAGSLVALGQPSWYQAEGVLVIHAQPRSTVDIQELPDPSPDTNDIQSELDILKSRLVIEPVVRSLKLWETPEFKYPQGWDWGRVEAGLGQMWREFWGVRRARKIAPATTRLTSLCKYRAQWCQSANARANRRDGQRIFGLSVGRQRWALDDVARFLPGVDA